MSRFCPHCGQDTRVESQGWPTSARERSAEVRRQRTSDRRRYVAMYARQGLGPTAIARNLQLDRGIEVTVKTVSRDLRALRGAR